MFFEHQIMWH